MVKLAERKFDKKSEENLLVPHSHSKIASNSMTHHQGGKLRLPCRNFLSERVVGKNQHLVDIDCWYFINGQVDWNSSESLSTVLSMFHPRVNFQTNLKVRPRTNPHTLNHSPLWHSLKSCKALRAYIQTIKSNSHTQLRHFIIDNPQEDVSVDN